MRPVAIVDYGMGNLFSVKQACGRVGLPTVVTNSVQDIVAASAVILPGVGSFGGAMEALTKLDLVAPLRDIAASETPMIGVCLGMQLLMTESHEFGLHQGLAIIEGDVVRLKDATIDGRCLKVPQVGWNRIHAVPRVSAGRSGSASGAPWESTLLAGVEDGEYMYFVHSFYCRVADASAVLSTTQYGATRFCSSLRYRNVFACQFHPERSGPQGLLLYKKLADLAGRYLREEHDGGEARSQVRLA